jgi:hypothetical protein
MDQDRLFEEHEALISRKIDLVDAAYFDAIDQGWEEPAVLILDLHHEAARAIGEHLIAPAEWPSFAVERSRRGEIPMVIVGLERSHLTRVLSDHTRLIGTEIDETRGAGFLLAVVTGGVSVFNMPPNREVISRRAGGGPGGPEEGRPDGPSGPANPTIPDPIRSRAGEDSTRNLTQ